MFKAGISPLVHLLIRSGQRNRRVGVQYFSGVISLLAMITFLTCPAWPIDPIGQLVITDPPWDQESSDHNTFPPTDLTEVRIFNGPDELNIEIPFQSDWDGLQLHVLIETNFDAPGAEADPFAMPVYYDHLLKPDFAMTCKYSSNDYGDFRRWNNDSEYWELFDPVAGTFIDFGETNILELWTEKGADLFSIGIPWAPFGGVPDSLMVEVYLTHTSDENVKRSAFDSVPSDLTLDLDFDYENPEPGDWDIALGPVYLNSWSPVYHVRTEFTVPPTISWVSLDPENLPAGDEFLLAAEVVDRGDGIGLVLTDLSPLGGPYLHALFDDGNPIHGDDLAGDGIYSLIWQIPENWSFGAYSLDIFAYDWHLDQHSSAEVSLWVMPGDPIVHAEDALGDDHGPNQPGVNGKYYTYPWNNVFVAGAFDLTTLDIHRTQILAGENVGEWLVFTVGMVAFPDPSFPGHANWNPFFGDLNIEKVDILIDSGPGGATATLPWRQGGYQPWDAWDYAVVVDGWYKAVIPSMGSNQLEDWQAQALTTNDHIFLVSHFPSNTIMAFVTPDALGNPTEDDIRSWDICVQMASHDFGGAEVLGGIRWVEESQSEWQFGGGQMGDRDANLIDLLLVPGTGNLPGRPQEYLLDYNTDEAYDRLAQGLTPVAIEMTQPGIAGIDPGGMDLFSLAQNSPNPFNPQTSIAYELLKRESVSLQVFDIAGRLVKKLITAEPHTPGRHEVVWNGRDDAGRQVASGTYFYRLEAGSYIETKRMVLIK